MRLFNMAGFTFFKLIKETPLDPFTAGNNAIAQLFAFFSTEQGQLVVADLRALNKDIISKIAGLIDHIHDSVNKPNA